MIQLNINSISQDIFHKLQRPLFSRFNHLFQIRRQGIIVVSLAATMVDAGAINQPSIREGRAGSVKRVDGGRVRQVDEGWELYERIVRGEKVERHQRVFVARIR